MQSRDVKILCVYQRKSGENEKRESKKKKSKQLDCGGVLFVRECVTEVDEANTGENCVAPGNYGKVRGHGHSTWAHQCQRAC